MHNASETGARLNEKKMSNNRFMAANPYQNTATFLFEIEPLGDAFTRFPDRKKPLLYGTSHMAHIYYVRYNPLSP